MTSEPAEHKGVCVHECVCTCMYMCVCVFMYVCVCMCACVYMCACVCVYVCACMEVRGQSQMSSGATHIILSHGVSLSWS